MQGAAILLAQHSSGEKMAVAAMVALRPATAGSAAAPLLTATNVRVSAYGSPRGPSISVPRQQARGAAAGVAAAAPPRQDTAPLPCAATGATTTGPACLSAPSF